MRIYGIIDILIFAKALQCDAGEMIGLGLLWMSFLLYLESRHRDKLRLKVSRCAWIIVGLPTLILLPLWLPCAFTMCAVLYTKKKRNRFFGCTSSIWRGLQGALIAFAFMPKFTLLAFILYAIRNLVGDFRDIGDDWNDGARTFPTMLGFRKNQVWAFWGHLVSVIATTILWFQFTNLSSGLLVICLTLQVISYPLTPRQSNPSYLMFCK